MTLTNGECIQSFEDVEALLGDFAVSYEFQEPGRYTVHVQLNGVDEKPSAEFPMEVVTTYRLDLVFPIIVVGTVAIIFAVLLIRWRSS